MAVHLKLHDLQTGKADRILRTSLDRLKSHNLVVEIQEKKDTFVQNYLPMLDSKLVDKVIYPNSNLSIYSFDENLMLILKARINLLYKFTNEKVRDVEFVLFPSSLKKSKTGRTRPTSALIPNVLDQKTRYQPLTTPAGESLGSIARCVRGPN